MEVQVFSPDPAFRLSSRPLTVQCLLFCLVLEVFKVYTQDRVQQFRALTFQFPVVRFIMEIFKVYTQDRVQQRFPCRGLTFQFLVVRFITEIFKVYTQDRVLHSVLPRRTLTSLFRMAVVLLEHSCPWSWSSSRFSPGKGFNGFFWS